MAGQLEQISISQPVVTQPVSGGSLHVEGIGVASFEQTLLVEVYDANNQVVGSLPIVASAPDIGQPGQFSADVPYNVAFSQPGRLVVRDVGIVGAAGTGIQEVATFSVDVSGPKGGVAVSNAHGTVTGAAGAVQPLMGVLVVNLASSGNTGDLLRAKAVVQTMKQSFPVIDTYAVKGPWPSNTKAENLLFFAGRPIERQSETEFLTKVAQLVEEQRLPTEALTLLHTRRTQPWEPGVVLTDDYAPYDLLIGSQMKEDRPEMVGH